jgi:2-keto-4-pentenoate hydratase
MSDKAISETAETILQEHRKRVRFSPLYAGRIGDLEFAYAVQDRLISLWQDSGAGDVIGWKVGATSAPMQAMVGISQPIAGAIFAGFRHESGAVLQAKDFIRLGIEAEIAVCMGAPILEAEVLEPEEILSRLACVSAAFEIVDDRAADYAALDAASLIVDNSWNKGVILGSPVEARGIKSLIGRQGVLTVDGTEVDRGMSEDVGGDPLRIVAWLGAHLARRRQPLRPGQWVLTGSIVTTKFPKALEAYHFAVQGLPAVEVSIE